MSPHREKFITKLLPEGIVFTQVIAGSDISLTDAKNNTRAVIDLTGGKVSPMLVDTRNIRSISKEARDHFSMRERKGHVNSIAILIHSPLSRIIGNFFMGLNKPSVPTKLFTDQRTAMIWLKTFLNK
jgi:hypothetical protein